MTTELFRIELASLVRDARVRWMGLILLALVALTFTGALRDSLKFSAELADINHAERSRWLEQRAKDPHSADHFGLWVFKPFAPLGVLEPGIDPYVGRMVRVEAHLFNDAVFRAVQDAVPLTRGGGGTVADIVQLIVPLLALLLGYSAFAADRERGTLRLALGNGALPAQWLLARSAALLTVVGALVGVPLLVLGLVATVVLPGQGDLPRLLPWVLAQMLYAGIFIGLAVAISLRASSARNALALSLASWVALCVLLPRLLALGVEMVEPTPSYQSVRAAIETESKEYNSVENDARREREFLAANGAARREDLRVDLRGSLMRVRERHNFAVFDRHFGEFFAQLERQDQLYGVAGAFAPKLALQAVSEAFANTSYANHIRFVWAAEHYRRGLSETMIQSLIDNPQQGDTRYLGDVALWRKIPDFVYRYAGFTESLRAVALPLLLLASWLVATFGAALLLARRIRL